MSFKTYFKIFPVIVNSLKLKHSINRPLFVNSGKYPTVAVNLCNHIHSKLYSTKPHTELKQVYYGVLTPQIKAVKVNCSVVCYYLTLFFLCYIYRSFHYLQA